VRATYGTVRRMRTRELLAFNTATQSDNKIHDDDVARRFGFSGGLVPGVDVYAYLCWGPVATWGQDWLERGTIEARFRLPTYDGESITVSFDEADGTCAATNGAGVEVAAGIAGPPTARADAIERDAGAHPWAPRPEDAARPPASPEVLAAGTLLGSWDVTFDADATRKYLADVREELPIYAELGIAHPGWVLRLANRLLSGNVVLGPWIHVGSTVRHHGLVHDGAKVSCRGTVAECFERKGHRFVRLDVGVLADEQLVATVDHTAIYQPRQVSAAG
jgi:acyl dehydratase